jgi:hypothetical protein
MERLGLRVEHVDPPWTQIPEVTWIHWPEAMFAWREPGAEEIVRFEGWIRTCAASGVVVWTVHNAFPHGWQASERYRAVYRSIAEHAQVHLHLGTRSIKEIESRYPSARPLVIRTCPHGGYWQLVGDLTPEAARRRLDIADTGRILLVFGEIRGPRELRLILQAIRAPGWHVLMAGRLASRRRPLWFIVNRLVRLIPTRRWTLITANIPDAEVDTYVKAADAVLIARHEALNSGNVFLGFTFGKPVIGPDIGNIGEVLTTTSNPTFDPKRPKTVVEALTRLAGMDMATLGRMNDAWLRENGRWEEAATVAYEAIGEASRKQAALTRSGISGRAGAPPN